MSLRSFASAPANNSGAMYAAVPTVDAGIPSLLVREAPRDTKIRQDSPAPVDQEVGRFHVPVRDAGPMRHF